MREQAIITAPNVPSTLTGAPRLLCSYTCPHPVADDFSKEPPSVPQHLLLTLLNVPHLAESAAGLPRPQHVILSHIYVQRGQVGVVGRTMSAWLCACGVCVRAYMVPIARVHG